MFFNGQNFIPLSRLAIRFDLPEPYLKKLADKNLIPSLNVNGRLKFNPAAVQVALNKIAASQEGESRNDE